MGLVSVRNLKSDPRHTRSGFCLSNSGKSESGLTHSSLRCGRPVHVTERVLQLNWIWSYKTLSHLFIDRSYAIAWEIMYLSSMTLHLLGRLASLCCQPEEIYGFIDLTPDSIFSLIAFPGPIKTNWVSMLTQLLLKAVVVPLSSNIREQLLLYLSKWLREMFS